MSIKLVRVKIFMNFPTVFLPATSPPPNLWHSHSMNKILPSFFCLIYSFCLLIKIQFIQNTLLLSFLHLQHFPILLNLVSSLEKCSCSFCSQLWVQNMWTETVQVISAVKYYLIKATTENHWLQSYFTISPMIPNFQMQNYFCKYFEYFVENTDALT